MSNLAELSRISACRGRPIATAERRLNGKLADQTRRHRKTCHRNISTREICAILSDRNRKLDA